PPRITAAEVSSQEDSIAKIVGSIIFGKRTVHKLLQSYRKSTTKNSFRAYPVAFIGFCCCFCSHPYSCRTNESGTKSSRLAFRNPGTQSNHWPCRYRIL